MKGMINMYKLKRKIISILAIIISLLSYSISISALTSSNIQETLQSYSKMDDYSLQSIRWINFDRYTAAHYKPDDNTYVDLHSLNPVSGQLSANSVPIRDFQYVVYIEKDKFTTRYTYTFYENGFIELTNCPSHSFSKSCYFNVDKTAYAQFLSDADKIWNNIQSWKPLWPEYAIAQNVQKITYTSSDGKHSISQTEPPDWRLKHWDEIKYIDPVKNDSVKTVKKDSVIKNAAKITVEYNTGAIFEIWQNSEHTLVKASNMDYAVLYETAKDDNKISGIDCVNRLAKGRPLPFPPNT